MHVLFVALEFPSAQARFVRALHAVGARVTGIGERPVSWLPDDLKHCLHGYEQISNVTDENQLFEVVRRVQSREWVDRLEATIEAHIMVAARVREATTIPGTSAQAALLCRDKPLMKAFLRDRGVPCAASSDAASIEELEAFAARVGFPLILKPRDGAGASGTYRVDNGAELRAAAMQLRVHLGNSVAIEEFIEGHEGFYDTLTVGGHVVHEFISHYYPNVLEAMRSRAHSPQIIATNRIDQPGYDEVKELGRRVVRELGLGTTATHMEWFFGPKGLKFSEIGARPPGVGQWDSYTAATGVDIYREWAHAITHGTAPGQLSRKYAAGIVALRPDRDGVIRGYEGVEAMQRRYGAYVVEAHLPPAGTPTQPVEAGYMANAWIRMKHPDYDALRAMLDDVGKTIRVRAA